jgi:hypothetical protein
MSRLSRLLLPVVLLGLTTAAQQIIEISEPATVTLKDLFRQADVVAVLYILSGDTESYDTTVYKSKVQTAFKGVAVDQRLFFGLYISYGVGSEYVAFFRRSKANPKPLPGGGAFVNHGPVEIFYRVMFEGYSILPIQYVCAFPGKDPCDYAVRVNTYQIKLPPGLKTFPRTAKDDFVEPTRWVRREDFLHLLSTLKLQETDR